MTVVSAHARLSRTTARKSLLTRERKFALGNVSLRGLLVGVGTVTKGELLGTLGQVCLLLSRCGRDGVGRDVLTTEVVRDRSVVGSGVRESLTRTEGSALFSAHLHLSDVRSSP